MISFRAKITGPVVAAVLAVTLLSASPASANPTITFVNGGSSKASCEQTKAQYRLWGYKYFGECSKNWTTGAWSFAIIHK